MVAKLKFEMEWKPTLDEAVTWGDLKLEMYNVVLEVLDKHLGAYYEEENNKHETVGGNEYISWSVYVVEDNKVFAYDIETALLWDGTCRVSIEGPREVDDIEELRSLANIADDVLFFEKEFDDFGYINCSKEYDVNGVDINGLYAFVVEHEGERYFIGTDGISYQTPIPDRDVIYEDDDYLVITEDKFREWFNELPEDCKIVRD